MKRKLLIVLIMLIFFTSQNSVSANTCTFPSESDSVYTLDVFADKTPVKQQVVYNVTVKLQIDEFGDGVSKIFNIIIYAKIKGESYENTKVMKVEEEIHNLINFPNSVSVSFSFDLTDVTGEVVVYGSASFSDYLFDGINIGTCTFWLNAHTLTLEANNFGYLAMIFAIGFLIILKRQKKKRV